MDAGIGKDDAGIARNHSAIEGLFLLAERGVPAASAGTRSARLSEGLSTWNDGLISMANEPTLRLSTTASMSAKEVARRMLKP